MSVVHLYSDNFEEVIGNIDRAAMVDFWASWCTPCRMIAPIVEELSDEFDGSLEVFKIDVDEAGEVASNHGVLSIPTLIFFKDGQEQERIVGYRSKEELTEIINKYID